MDANNVFVIWLGLPWLWQTMMNQRPIGGLWLRQQVNATMMNYYMKRSQGQGQETKQESAEKDHL
jgi:hypothetical protein